MLRQIKRLRLSARRRGCLDDLTRPVAPNRSVWKLKSIDWTRIVHDEVVYQRNTSLATFNRSRQITASDETSWTNCRPAMRSERCNRPLAFLRRLLPLRPTRQSASVPNSHYGRFTPEAGFDGQLGERLMSVPFPPFPLAPVRHQEGAMSGRPR